MFKRAVGAAFAVGACVGIWAACGGTSSPGGSTGGDSCANFEMTSQCSCTGSGSTTGSCFEYANALGNNGFCFADGGSDGQGCLATDGQNCSTSNRVGTCWQGAFSDTRYYSPTFTTQTAQTACQTKGGCFVAN